MEIKYKWIVVIELIVIIFLIVMLIVARNNLQPREESEKLITEENNTRLLSQRVYAHLLEPRNLLIANFQPLKEGLQTYISKKTKEKGSISVYVENLRNGASFGIDEKKGYYQASLNKIPTAIVLLEKIEQGELSFNTLLKVEDNYKTDVYGELYTTDKKELPVNFVLEKMLKESDNTAFNIILSNIDKEDLDFFLAYSGYFNKQNMTDQSKNNQFISPKSMYNTFSSLYFSTLLDINNSEYILSLLTDTVFNVRKLAELSDDVIIAQKFGEATYEDKNYFHSCGIMYIQQSRIFYCIMTEDLPKEESQQAIITIIKAIYKYVYEVRTEFNEYKEKVHSLKNNKRKIS